MTSQQFCQMFYQMFRDNPELLPRKIVTGKRPYMVVKGFKRSLVGYDIDVVLADSLKEMQTATPYMIEISQEQIFWWLYNRPPVPERN